MLIRWKLFQGGARNGMETNLASFNHSFAVPKMNNSIESLNPRLIQRETIRKQLIWRRFQKWERERESRATAIWQTMGKATTRNEFLPRYSYKNSPIRILFVKCFCQFKKKFWFTFLTWSKLYAHKLELMNILVWNTQMKQTSVCVFLRVFLFKHTHTQKNELKRYVHSGLPCLVSACRHGPARMEQLMNKFVPTLGLYGFSSSGHWHECIHSRAG